MATNVEFAIGHAREAMNKTERLVGLGEDGIETSAATIEENCFELPEVADAELSGLVTDEENHLRTCPHSETQLVMLNQTNIYLSSAVFKNESTVTIWNTLYFVDHCYYENIWLDLDECIKCLQILMDKWRNVCLME